MKNKENKKFFIGLLVGIAIFLLCSWSYRLKFADVDVRTINEGGHKYVVTTATNNTGSSCSVAIVHSAECSCNR